ncbi:PD-(D/E)XK motif protein [Microbacterium sp. UFMG61]|uniref:PD-(D/E)XK motif protein n=1 Tax=Microbacterium sp. UFMG61 TaxID=2745935 RepID=UPI00188DEE68|nr:PD-(D/E)XK motif protein [Microbacterium sp. UFMG61]
MSDPELTRDTIEDYFAAGAEVAFPIGTSRGATLEIDPNRQQLRLICPATGAEPDVTRYERIGVERINIIGHGGDWYRLTIDARDMHYEAYGLIVSIVDQLDGGVSFQMAVNESLEGLRELLSGRRRLTAEKEAGLIGELLVLEHLLLNADEDTAITSWLGPLAEEHDFGLEHFEAEVKTTRSEARVHVIGSETQLQPSLERPLFLISIQITLAGDSSAAFTLPDAIGRIRTRLDLGRRAFDRALLSAGWTDDAADLYTDRFELRSTPRAYAVENDFPAITSTMLDAVVPQRSLVGGVSYRIDVSHLKWSTAPAPLGDLCERNETK